MKNKIFRVFAGVMIATVIASSVTGCDHSRSDKIRVVGGGNNSNSTNGETYLAPIVEESKAVDEKNVKPDEAAKLDEQREEIGIDDASIDAIKKYSTKYYCYSVMDSSLHDLYAEIYTILMEEGEDVKVSATSDKDLSYVFQCVFNDHPEIYWVDGFSYVRHEQNGEVLYYTFTGKYTYTVEERRLLQVKIDSYVSSALAGISVGASEYEKVKYVYDYIVENTEYDLMAEDNQNILSVFLNGRSVCSGYAKAMQYLLYRLGVECTMVVGKVESGEGHAWNLVNIDGAYYYVDVTWGDASYILDGEEKSGNDMPINYDYLNVTTQELLMTHIIDNVVPMPMCISTAANYYYAESALFYSYDYNQLYTLFSEAYASGESVVTIKCADAAAFQNMYTELIDNQHVFEFLHSQEVSYTFSDETYTFNFWL